VEFPEYMAIRHPIVLREEGKNLSLPDWAKAEIWLGWWCRNCQLEGKRLLVVAVLPSRKLSAAFAGLGCLLAGAKQFHGGFTWDDLRNLPEGSKIFWNIPGNHSRYEGEIGKIPDWDSNLVSVLITRGARRDVGTVWYFSAQRFSECLFSEECMPTQRRTIAMDNVLRLHGELGLDTKASWIWTAGTEAQIVTNQTKFWDNLDDLEIGSKGSNPLRFEDTLCAAKGNDRTLSKLRVVSVGQIHEQNSLLTILDGGDSFDHVQDIESGNVLILLDRTEYTMDKHNQILDACNSAIELSPGILPDPPAELPPGLEITAFVMPNDRT